MGILEANTIKQVKMNENIKRKYLRRTRNLLETKLYSKNRLEAKYIKCWLCGDGDEKINLVISERSNLAGRAESTILHVVSSVSLSDRD